MDSEGNGVSMWARAVALLEEAERRHRRFFELLSSAPQRQPVWEPPVDMFLLEHELRVVVAMPAVHAEDVTIELVAGGLVVRAESRLPVPAGLARIVRLEIPYGRIERRIELPAGRFELAAREFRDGCLQLRLIGEWP
jgi:HSP20 family molecular chaperone IbpA